jgi:hypothetical protein
MGVRAGPTVRVPPALARQVLARDGGCVAPRLGGTILDCWGRNRIEHVQTDYGRTGRRADNTLWNLVTLCQGHTEDGMRAGYVWATDHANRERCRDHLRKLYPDKLGVAP